VPGGRAGNSAANPSSMPCTRLSLNAPDFFLGPTSPSASSRVSPCTRDQHARIAPAIFRSLREVSGMARPRPPATITPASSALVFSASASCLSANVCLQDSLDIRSKLADVRSSRKAESAGSRCSPVHVSKSDMAAPCCYASLAMRAALMAFLMAAERSLRR